MKDSTIQTRNNGRKVLWYKYALQGIFHDEKNVQLLSLSLYRYSKTKWRLNGTCYYYTAIARKAEEQEEEEGEGVCTKDLLLLRGGRGYSSSNGERKRKKEQLLVRS